MRKPSLIADLLDRLNAEHRYEFEERAGTIEFDAVQSREQAERLALVDLLRSYPAALLGLSFLQVKVGGVTEVVLTTDIDDFRDRLVVVDTVDLTRMVQRQFGGMAVLRRFQQRS